MNSLNSRMRISLCTTQGTGSGAVAPASESLLYRRPTSTANPAAHPRPRLDRLRVAVACGLGLALLGCGRGERTAADEASAESAAGKGGAVALPGIWAMRDDPRQIWFIDPAGGSGLFERTEIEQTPRGLAYLQGAVWVATEGGKIVKVDAKTRLVATTVDAGNRYPVLAAGHGAVWVAAQEKILRLDPGSADIAAQIPFDRDISALVSGPSGIYALSGASVVRLDPATNAVAGRADLGKGGGHGYGEIAVGRDEVWMADQYSKRLYALDPVSLQVRKELEIPKHWDGELAVGAESLFFSFGQREEAKVVAVNPADAAVRFEIALDARPKHLRVVNGVLIVTPGAFGELRFFDEKTGKPRGELPGEYAEVIALDGGGGGE